VVPRFKLKKLSNKDLRYEVIYKNLLRDMRKFYLQEFNMVTDFQTKKKKNGQDYYVKSVEAYLKLMKVLRPEDEERGVTSDSLLYNFSRFIYPKELNKAFQYSDKNETVYGVYDSLYKFSLQKLNLFTTDASLNRLFSYYF
jgi:hypothetical protein